jgi:hypothetical protein
MQVLKVGVSNQVKAGFVETRWIVPLLTGTFATWAFGGPDLWIARDICPQDQRSIGEEEHLGFRERMK